MIGRQVVRTVRCGHCGMLRPVEDTRVPIDDRTLEERALRALAVDLEGAPEDCWRLFEALFASDHFYTSGKQLASDLGAVHSSLISRFFRANLPAPKAYIARVILLRAAAFLEHDGATIKATAHYVGFSSPQAFARSMRRLTGQSTTKFFHQRTADLELARFRADMITPYLEQLRNFSPLRMRGQGKAE